MHLIRLLLSGVQVLQHGFVPLRVDEYRERLLAIRRGEVPWQEVERWRLAAVGSPKKYKPRGGAPGPTPSSGGARLRVWPRRVGDRLYKLGLSAYLVHCSLE